MRNKTDLIYEEGLSLEESEEAIRKDVAAQLGREDFTLVFVCSRQDAPAGLAVLNDAIMEKMPAARREKYILTAEARTGNSWMPNGRRHGAMCAAAVPMLLTMGSILSSE